MDDRDIVRVQIGRPPRSIVTVSARCHLGLPTVTAVPPRLDDGTPFPTRYWLTCPLAVRRIGRIEATGGVRAAEARLAADPTLAARHHAAGERYRRDRDALLDPADQRPRPVGGVGGTRRGVKCLHAHYADHAAGNDNPIGEHTAADIEPLDCARPCVVAAGDAAVANPDWKEPRR